MARFRSFLSAQSPIVAWLLANAMVSAEGAAAMQAFKSWATLSQLTRTALPVSAIIGWVSQYSREEALYTLSRIAADLANATGGVLSADARAWTRDLLVQSVESENESERMVARAVANMSLDVPIAHGQVVHQLQQLVLLHGIADGVQPADGQLAFLMLALNDHLPEWPAPHQLSSIESAVSTAMFSSIFNRSSDSPLHFLVRTTEILRGDVAGSPMTTEQWLETQRLAFGCSFDEYAELFLAPLFVLSRGWGAESPPIIVPAAWYKSSAGGLYERWFREASVALADAPARFRVRPLDSGLHQVPGAFYRTPFVEIGDMLLALSPWHVKDHASLGTWAKLNAAAKTVLETDSNQGFTSTFGILFEKWCAGLAAHCAQNPAFEDRLLVPSSPGAADEIEDVVLIGDDTVALMSAKSSLVPENALKYAESQADSMRWLERFFFEDPESAKSHGHRGGVLLQLDAKIQRLRAGEWEGRGVRKDAAVLPVVLSFDNVGENGILYKWILDRCAASGILNARPGVLPLAIATPETYEYLLALGLSGQSICNILRDRAKGENRLQPLGWFLHQIQPLNRLRLPLIEQRFDALLEASRTRLAEIGVFAAEREPEATEQ